MTPDELVAIRKRDDEGTWTYGSGWGLAALVDRRALLALVDTLTERVGSCVCNRGPWFEGPDEECPQHGRPYAEWIDRGDILSRRADALLAQVARVEALGLRLSLIRDKEMRGLGAAILNALAEPAAEGGEQ